MLNALRHCVVFLGALNPAVIVYALAGSLVLLRRLSAGRKFHDSLKLLLFIAFVGPVVAGFASSYISLIPGLFVLRSDWFVSSLFGSIEASSIPILIALLFIVCSVAMDYQKLSFSFCLRFVLHVGSAVGVLFAQDAMSVLFYLELVVIISAAIVIGDRKVPRKDAISYAALHVLSSILIITGVLAGVGGVTSAGFGSAFDLTIVSLICFSVSVAISIGLPPFGFLFVDVYGVADTRNSIALASFLSKLAVYTYIPMVSGGIRVVMQFCGLLFVPYIFVRLLFQRSLKKIVLLSLLAHSASIVLFASCVNFSTDGLVKLYVAVCILVAFFALSAVRIIEARSGGQAQDVALLCSPGLKKDKALTVLVLLLSLLLSSFPGSVVYLVESALITSIKSPLIGFALIAIQALSVMASSKIVLGLFGLLPVGRSFGGGFALAQHDARSDVVFRRSSIDFSFAMFVLLMFVVLCCGGLYWPIDFGEVGQASLGSPFNAHSLLHYSSAFLLGVGSSFVLVKLPVTKEVGGLRGYNFMSVATEFVLSLYSVFVDILLILAENVFVCFRFALRLFKVATRKIAVSEFSLFYSSEAVVCIAVFVLAFLAMLLS